MGGALGDAQAGRDVTQSRARFAGDAQQQPGMVGPELQLAAPKVSR
jgi:hypothetical protein